MTESPSLVCALHRQFDEQGYVILKDFLEPEIIQQARDEINPLVDREAEKLIATGKISDPLTDEPFETRLARLYEKFPNDAPHIFRRELHLAGLFDVFFHSRLLDVVETLLGSELRLYPNYSVRPKLPDHAPTLVLWHQDGGYTQSWHLDEKHAQANVAILRMVNVWTPLVPAREENGCMQFIPGTHTIGLAPHEQR
ncbi:MAG: phytanoyl-CoA dioxygenase family protein, partial [Candidatus Latescibacteria bacterium]|nr:phytanoyl-CoA dioxygenase family protein [Candidatus Latescibacterota bacterium]